MENVDNLMMDTYACVALDISARASSSGKEQYLVGIAGPPGVGKSTFAAAVQRLIPHSIVVPMDGYHFYKAQLREFSDPEEAFRRRGAPWTFDSEKFVKDVRQLRESGEGKFPSFDHGMGDPVEDAICVTKEHQIVLIEGNYLLLEEAPWCDIKSILDLTIFLSADLEVVKKRILKRHISVGRSAEQAMERIETNDALNAIQILQFAGRADVTIHSK